MIDKLVSILIPTYNTSLYLGRALLSALGQSYRNIEIVVVDDASTDGTKDLLLSAAHMDHRIRVYQFEDHRGVGAARNKCLQEAKGEYIFWLDSDDYISNDCIELLLSLMEKENSRAARVDFSNEGKGLITMDTTAYLSTVLTDEYKSYLAGTLFTKSAFEDIAFPENSVVEDYTIYPDIAAQIDRITIIKSKDLYFYTANRPGSLTMSCQKALQGQHDRMIAAFKRYDAFSGTYERECRTVLKQATAYAVMTWYLGKNEKNKAAYGDAYQCLLEHKEMINRDVDGRLHSEAMNILYHPFRAWIFYCLHMLKRNTVGSR